jgi:hypothetical protein
MTLYPEDQPTCSIDGSKVNNESAKRINKGNVAD